jgi:type IV pilus assembly protein PilE
MSFTLQSTQEIIMNLINNCRSKKYVGRQSGVTLIELLIAIVLISIIAASAYPSYTQYIVRAKRTAGKSVLLQVADRQQQYFMDNKRYANSLTTLGYQENPFMVSDDGDYVAMGDADRAYMIAMVAPTPTTYTLIALPQMMMATKDTDCAILFLLSTGQKGATGGSEKCW